MRLDLVLHDEKETAETLQVERPVLAETHVEGRLRVGDEVHDVFDLVYGGGVSGRMSERAMMKLILVLMVYVPWRAEDRDMGGCQGQRLS